MPGIRIPLALLGLALAPCGHAQVVWNVSFDASASVLTAPERAQVTSHLQEAGRRWAAAMGVTAPRSIEIEVRVASVPTANGSSVTSSFVGVINGRNTFEQGVASELRTGIDPNAGEPDGFVIFGLAYLRNELWFDPDPVARIAPVPADRTDAMSVALHEIGHVIGYNGWADLQTGVPPPTFWSTFDRWMQPGAPTLFTGPRAVRRWGGAPDLTTGNNKHWGNPVAGLPAPARQPVPQVQWRDGRPAPQPACRMLSLSAPPPGSALDRLRLPGGSPRHELMNGVVFFRGNRYDITPLDRATLDDLDLILDRLLRSGFQ